MTAALPPRNRHLGSDDDRIVDSPVADGFDADLALGATGQLRAFNQAGVLSAADVHVAQRLSRLGDETDESVLLAVAMAVRAVRFGSVCVELARVREIAAPEDGGADLDWPPVSDWTEACAHSELVAVGRAGDPSRPLRLVEGLLYLDRYWREEELVRRELDQRAARPVVVDGAVLSASLARLFPAPALDRQRLAAAMTALRTVSVVAGGPGTGKTTAVARVLELLHDQPGPTPRIALAAPTGKAAARLQEAVRHSVSEGRLAIGALEATTIHRLLGRRPESRTRFRHDRHNRLPYDVVVVDETSMVSLTLMSRLLEAVRLEARLVFVGDPDQLASVEAGAVLGDLVARPAAADSSVPSLLTELVGDDLEPGEAAGDALRNGVVRLTRTHRFGETIGALARAVQSDDADSVLEILRSADSEVSFVEPAGDAFATESLREDVVSAASELTAAARAGEVVRALSLLESHRLLCAHRRGPYGVAWWAATVERWIAESGEVEVGEWYLGRPLLVTENDYDLRIFNGDTGVVVDGGPRGPVAAFKRGEEPLLLSPGRLASVQTVHAMTVHRAQGSQFDRVSLVLPPSDSPLLSRELFYTAITRAKKHVRVLGSEESVRAAVGRPIARASGLRRR